MRTYRVNRPTTGKDRSTGSNARVVCSTLLRAMPIRQEIMPFPLSAYRLHARPPFLLCGRGTSAYANLLGSFVGCVRTRGIEKAMGRDRLCFLALPTSRTHLPRNNPCDSVAYAEGVQKRKAFLFLSFSYFSDKRKVLCAFLLLFGQAKKPAEIQPAFFSYIFFRISRTACVAAKEI